MRRVMSSLAVFCALTGAGVAQQPASTPAFEAASVKPAIPGTRGFLVSYTPDSLRAVNATLASLIQSAYGIRDDRLVGGPSWVRTRRFDVTAKAAEALPREQLRVMAQRLLESRFGLVLRREQREQEAYVLRLAREDGRLGPDVRRAADDCMGTAAGGGLPTALPAQPALKSSTGADPTFSGRCATIASVAEGVSRSLGIEVVDQTGLQGRWDYVLAYSKLAPTASPTEPGQASLPTVFAAVEEQLGLKLERNPHGTAEYVVIAAAHPPTDN
jgi:bla regulator protein blaR1